MHFVFCISYHIIKNGTYINSLESISTKKTEKCGPDFFLQNPAGFLWTLLHHHLRFGSSSFEVRPGHHTEGARDQPSFEITNARHLRLAAPEEKPTRLFNETEVLWKWVSVGMYYIHSCMYAYTIIYTYFNESSSVLHVHTFCIYASRTVYGNFSCEENSGVKMYWPFRQESPRKMRSSKTSLVKKSCWNVNYEAWIMGGFRVESLNHWVWTTSEKYSLSKLWSFGTPLFWKYFPWPIGISASMPSIIS